MSEALLALVGSLGWCAFIMASINATRWKGASESWERAAKKWQDNAHQWESMYQRKRKDKS